MILCDTNIIIELYRNNNHIREELVKIGQSNIVVSDVTAGELFFGARNKAELRVIQTDLNKLVRLPVNEAISIMAVSFVEKYTLSHNLNLPDSLIAATALYHNIPLFTLNKKDFSYLEVALYDF